MRFPFKFVKPRYLIPIAVMALGAFYYYENSQQTRQIYMGIPQHYSYLDKLTTHVLRNDAYLTGYSETYNNPLWVSYRLLPVIKKRKMPRPRHFSTDTRSLSRIEPNALSHSGYQRGHLAPNYAISQIYGKTAQQQTFLMTNISPQKAHLNQKVWQRLEEQTIDYFTPRFGQLWVITGPIFSKTPKTTRSGISIPDAFYKILVVPGKQPKILAFIIPQEVSGREPLTDFVTTVDKIEALTGLDFMHQLPDMIESAVEAENYDEAYWRLKKVSRKPPRF